MKDKKKTRIADIPSLRTLRKQARDLEAVSKSRLLKIFGIELPEEVENEAPSLARQAERLSSLPDRFNGFFSERGWIAYDRLHMMEEAVELAERGKIDDAENLLVEQFDRQALDLGINSMFTHPAFAPRERLARLAMQDHLAGRYHASIPVVLSLIDGFVNDVSQSKGAFAEGTELKAWDSIAGHGSGLQVLKALMTTSRTKTTEVPLSLPYRHGIMHGRDLAYDNQLVASKAWAMLFALREWASAAREGNLEKPAPKETSDLFSTLAQTVARKRQGDRLRERARTWKPRTENELSQAARAGDPEDYEQNTPEQAVARLVALLQSGNYGHAAPFLRLPGEPLLEDQRLRKLAGKMRRAFGSRKLLGLRFVGIEETAPPTARIRVTVQWQETTGAKAERTVDLHLVHLDAEGTPVPSNSPEGSWTVPNLWLIA